MANSIAINLLPKEVLTARSRSVKVTLAYKISIVLLIILAIVTSTILSVRFSQKIRLQQAQDQTKNLENKISALNQREQQLITIKQKLASIAQLTGGDKAEKELFDKMVSLVPPEMTITEAMVDPKGTMEISATTTSLPAIDTFIKAIEIQMKTSNMIQKLELESLSLDPSGDFKMLFKILPPGTA